jgi:hypothetical protein
MKILKTGFLISLLSCCFILSSQTTINAGPVSGSWTKTGSPYKINGDIYVAQGQTFRIQPGVKLEFQGPYTLHVWGSLQAIGAPGDTVVFTGKNSSTLWKGVFIHKNQSGADSNLISHCLFQYAKHLDYVQSTSNWARGALRCDTLDNILIENSRFYKNTCNTGAGVKGLRSKLYIRNCLFHFNTALDERTNLPLDWYAGGSAITSGLTDMIIEGCIFRNNLAHAPNDPRDTTIGLGRAVVGTVGSNLSILNSVFDNNTCTNGYTVQITPLSHNKTITITNCDFISNTNGFEPIFEIYNQGNYFYGKTVFKNCRFTGNTLSRGKFKQVCISVINPNGLGNTVLIEDCLFYRNVANQNLCNVVLMNNFVNGTVRRCRFIGNRAIPLNIWRDSRVWVDNCLFANNYVGMWWGQHPNTSDITISNSAFLNNRLPAKDSAKFKGGVYFPVYATEGVGPDIINFYNCIFWGNIGDKGQTANIYTEGKKWGGRVNLLQNTYLQGGLSSTLNNDQSTANITTYNNIFTDTLVFVKPSTAAGPDYADTTSDWHIINTCTNVPATYNKGFTPIKDPDGATLTLSKSDLAGNARVYADTLDIGPYEVRGLKARIALRSTSGTDSICLPAKKLLKSEWLGTGLTYTWERRALNNPAWLALQTSDTANFLAAPNQTYYYRVKAIQSECGLTDSSQGILLIARPKPIMLQAPAGDSVCLGNSLTIKSNWQGGRTYIWESSEDGVNAWQPVQTSDSGNLLLKPNGNIYYRLRVSAEFCSKDSISPVIAAGVFPLPKPALGKDTGIQQKYKLVLDPGTFSSYRWNTGDTGSTLSITGTSEPLGTKPYSVTVKNGFGCEGSDTIRVTIEKNVSVQSMQSAGWKIYPVPATDVLYIESPDGYPFVYSLADMNGRIVMREQGSGSITAIKPEKGRYILIIETGGMLMRSAVLSF